MVKRQDVERLAVSATYNFAYACFPGFATWQVRLGLPDDRAIPAHW